MATFTESQQVQFMRLIRLRNDLDKTENRTTLEMLRTFDETMAVINTNLKKRPEPTTKAAKAKLQKDLKAAYSTLAKQLEQIIVQGGAEVFKEGTEGVYNILSWNGHDPTIKQVPIPSTKALESSVANYSFGQMKISGWITEAFGTMGEAQKAILDLYEAGGGYQKMLRSLIGPYSNINQQMRQEMITLARTTTQQAAIQSELEMFKENADVIKAARWTAVMEIGYTSSGRGTCPRCAALDGQDYKTDENGEPINAPPMTLHPRCRCMWIPITKTWEELLGIDGLVDPKTGKPLEESEAEDIYRTFKDREEANIDAGRSGKYVMVDGKKVYQSNVKEYIDAGGTYGDFVSDKPEYLVSTFGPNRARLVLDGTLNVEDLVNTKTGELFTLKQLGYPLGSKDN